MRRMLVVLLALGFAGAAMAANIGTTPDLSMKGLPGDGAMDGREGGETVADALPIPSLPYTDTGATCDNINDYDEICPYSGSASPDVVYSYAPGADGSIDVDLCYSGYDTKVYVYENAVGNLVACNDDFYFGAPCYTYSSKVENVPVYAGNTYYIVVDGYGSACGSYQMDVTEGLGPCVVECPDGALQEGEPPCVDGYYDLYNGGCNSTGWTLVQAQTDDGCATMCGKSCTYNYQGLSYRDTDWYEATAAGGLVTLTCTAEFPLQLLDIYGTDCNALLYDLVTANPCIPANTSHNYTAGATFWIWVGASVFSGVPESDYVFDVCGLEHGVIPTVETTWGSIKTRF